MRPPDCGNAEQDDPDAEHNRPSRPWEAKGRHGGGPEGHREPGNTLGLELTPLSHSARHAGNLMKRWMASLALS